MTINVNSISTLPETTIREKQVLYKLCEGYTAKEIAKELYISTHTVLSHKRNLLSKLRAKNTPHLTAIAISIGIVSLAK